MGPTGPLGRIERTGSRSMDASMSGEATEAADVPDTEAFRVRTPAESCQIGDVRRAFRAWLVDQGADADELGDWALIVSELVANARAASPPGTSIEVDANRLGRRTVLRVRNHAAEVFHPRVPDEVGPERLHGRGMLIADRLSDGLAFDVTEQVTVTCWKESAAPESAG
jgi:anti-sigma regulatory factor (Ser/Thr protein kinase)